MWLNQGDLHLSGFTITALVINLVINNINSCFLNLGAKAMWMYCKVICLQILEIHVHISYFYLSHLKYLVIFVLLTVPVCYLIQISNGSPLKQARQVKKLQDILSHSKYKPLLFGVKLQDILSHSKYKPLIFGVIIKSSWFLKTFLYLLNWCTF